jgi:hypothetical protein
MERRVNRYNLSVTPMNIGDGYSRYRFFSGSKFRTAATVFIRLPPITPLPQPPPGGPAPPPPRGPAPPPWGSCRRRSEILPTPPLRVPTLPPPTRSRTAGLTWCHRQAGLHHLARPRTPRGLCPTVNWLLIGCKRCIKCLSTEENIFRRSIAVQSGQPLE